MDDADRSVLISIVIVAIYATISLWLAIEINLYLGAFLEFLLIAALMERLSDS